MYTNAAPYLWRTSLTLLNSIPHSDWRLSIATIHIFDWSCIFLICAGHISSRPDLYYLSAMQMSQCVMWLALRLIWVMPRPWEGAYSNSVIYIKERFGLIKLHISSLNTFVISLQERKLNVWIQRCHGALLQLQNSASLRFHSLVTENISSTSRSYKQDVASFDCTSATSYSCVTLA
jgi:hypothetical protein